MVELAIAWLLANPLVGSVIAGATRPAQVQANASASGWDLSDEELQHLDDMLGEG
jgi:aryl-alcohol dehydrogenase-like predicted oxidoreductase